MWQSENTAGPKPLYYSLLCDDVIIIKIIYQKNTTIMPRHFAENLRLREEIERLLPINEEDWANNNLRGNNMGTAS
jgi:hypothetical protein